MKLLIHDLSSNEWENVADKYSGFEVISDNGQIKSCVGCFGCWTKTPGECVIKDGYEKMGLLIHRADEVVVISRYTYGGFSSFIKNVFDRSISYVLPYFELVGGEMHHKSRYPEEKPMTFIFRGHGLTEEDKAKAKSYVQAVCTNLHGIIKDVIFEEHEESTTPKLTATTLEKKTILLNCSYRGDNANSKKFLNRLASGLTGEVQSLNLVSYAGRYEDLVKDLLPAETIVLGMPLYVDGVPSAALRIMEMLEKRVDAGQKKIYVVANMGFYESAQIKHLLSIVKTWCDKAGFTYGGGLAIGAGEMMKMMVESPNMDKGPAHNIAVGMSRLTEAINASGTMEDFYADAEKFPRFMYMMAANMGWPKAGKQNGLKKKDLLRRLA